MRLIGQAATSTILVRPGTGAMLRENRREVSLRLPRSQTLPMSW